MDYITMIFDLKHSRDIRNRNQVQHMLIEVIKQCNEQFADMIQAPFLITLGDEWEGLLKPSQNYHTIIKFFHQVLPGEIDFYVGVGIGEVTVNDFELTVNQLDGPSFYLAREAIDYAKSRKHELVVLK